MIHQDLTQLTPEQLVAIIQSMQAKSATKITFKVSEKGAISAFGLQRFPVTLYASQWERILAEADTLRAFIKANAPRLATKP